MRYTLIHKILSSPLEDKIHIFAPPCNILYKSRPFAISRFFIATVEYSLKI